jgi:ABC-2 type transport system ATP-binding protein
MSKAIVEISKLTKSFKIPLEASSGIKQQLINILKGRKGYRVFTPLKDISFTINEGDFFGIVGRNGSGKSTLLKTIAGSGNLQSYIVSLTRYLDATNRIDSA